MKSNTRKILLGASTVAALAVAGGIPEANAATTKANITAKILAPVAITKTASLKFGKLTVAAATAGTVTVKATADSRTAGGAGGVSLVGGAAAQRGGYKVSGAANESIKISMPTKATIKSGANTMDVTNFQHDTKGAMNPGQNFNLGAGGAILSEKFGATLVVPAGQATGSYTGTVTITANYL